MARARVGTVLGTMEVIDDDVECTFYIYVHLIVHCTLYTMMVMIGPMLNIGDGPKPYLFPQ